MSAKTQNAAKCMRPGPITKNGYLNFLREYRQKHCGLTVVETVRRGAAEWNKLSEEQKNKYTQMGCMIGGSGRSASGGKCMRPGPVTRNGYLNFLRDYRRKHCGLTAVETVRQGAAEWNKLSEEMKNKYTQMGCMIGGRSKSRSGSRSRRSASAPRRSALKSRSLSRVSRSASAMRVHKSRSRSRSGLRRRASAMRGSKSRSRLRRRATALQSKSRSQSRLRRRASAVRSKSRSHSRQRRSASSPRMGSRKSRRSSSAEKSGKSRSRSSKSRRSMVCHISPMPPTSHKSQKRASVARLTGRKSQRSASASRSASSKSPKSRRSVVCHRM